MKSVILVGAGKMGGALAARWKETGIFENILIVDPATGDIGSAADIPAAFHPDVVVFAVKPQSLEDIIGGYARYADGKARYADGKTLFLSIAAGKPIAFFERHLGTKAPVVRCMPNLPASIGAGITVICTNANVQDAQKHQAENLMGAVGEVIWAADEALLDPVTALSGSGPAYVFLLIEMLTKAGTDIGLPQDMAEKLARKTIIGSAALAATSPLPASTLRENVTSPGGTTEAALKVLMDGKMQELISSALTSALKRARKLSG